LNDAPTGGLPPEVVRFVRRHITSAGQLDVLLLLRGAPERSWPAASVAREVYGDVAAVAPLLDSLSAQGFLETTPEGYRYTRMRHRVIRAIYEAPDPAVSFSEAFRLRKRKD
jgi:hypothetical protein